MGLLAAGALWAGCTPAPAGEGVADAPGAGSGTETVVLAVGHQTRWRQLRIEGETDLPDGAVVTWQVTHALANELPRGEWPAQNLLADGDGGGSGRRVLDAPQHHLLDAGPRRRAGAVPGTETSART